MAQTESWPYQEAQRILDRIKDPAAPVILQTGFGPSGFPHIGTFGEVTRTTFIRRALADLGASDVKLYCFSDDMDGLRKVPLNFPSWLGEHLGKTLNEIPDPFGCCDSFSGHMNGKLNEMLRRFGFDYEFKSSVVQYRTGVFNDGLQRMLERSEQIRSIILPTLGEDKREAWSPFLPICTRCRRLYTTRVTGYHPDRSTVSYVCDGQVQSVKGCGNSGETSVLDGKCKVGWKADWALRWFAYGVTYEMYGKDLIESATLSGRIIQALGGTPPLGYFFELFLDETGAKISKSVGKGVTVDTWLKYAPLESIALFMYRNPRRAKKLFLGTIPQYVDELLDEVEAHYAGAQEKDGKRSTYRFLDPAPPQESPYVPGLRWSMLTGLAGTIGTPEPDVLARYVEKGIGWPKGDDRRMRELIGGALLYSQEVELPGKKAYAPTGAAELSAIAKLNEYLGEPRPGDEIQNRIYDLAREVGLEPKELFRSLYLTIIGQERGPRLGTFITVLGQDRVREILARSVTGA